MKNEYYIDTVEPVVIIYLKYKDEVMSTVIDLEDFSLVDSFPNKWMVNHDKATNTFRVVGRITKNKKTTVYPMHRWILGPGSDEIVDHLNHNGLDNRKANMRIVDKRGNGQNREKAASNNSTGLLGVSFFKRTGKFTAQIRVNDKKKHLGYFNTKEEAHEAYLKARKEFFGI